MKSWCTVWVTVVDGKGLVHDGHRDFALQITYRTDLAKRVRKLLKEVEAQLVNRFCGVFDVVESYITCHQVKTPGTNGTVPAVIANDDDKGAWTWTTQGKAEKEVQHGS